MDLLINGQPRDVPADATVESLLAWLQLRRDGIAVAVNGAVVPRGERARTRLAAGDRVEILTAVGGG